MKLRHLRSAAAVTALTGLVAFGLVAPASAQTTVTANSDTASVVEDGSVSIDVLANDLPASGLTLQAVTDPDKGTAAIVAGRVLYTPKADFNGTDTFAYTVTDGTSTVGAAVTVTVSPVNDAPVAKADSAKTTVGTAKTLHVLGNDKDKDGDSLVVVLQSQPAHGTASLDVATPKVTYTPVAGYVGQDSFSYYASDGVANSATVTVSLTIKVADSDDSKSAKVLAICAANTADTRISGLCGVYASTDMPPWALAKLGHVILKLDASKHATQVDAVLTACAAEDDDNVEWLCDLYKAGDMPPGIKALVGQRILLLSQGEGSQNVEGDDDKKKDHKPWKLGLGWGHHDKGDNQSNAQSISFGNDDDHKDRDDRDNDRRTPGRKGGHGWGHWR